VNLAEEWPVGTRVEKPGFGYEGEVRGVERAHRTDWVVVHWDGRPFTAREYPSALVKVVAS
jgi:hypothetical protein